MYRTRKAGETGVHTKMPSSSSLGKPKRFSEREKEGFRHANRKLGIRGGAPKKGRMGSHKQKWTSEEEQALLAGIAKHRAGKWKTILTDPEFAQALTLRSNIDLKVEWFGNGDFAPEQHKWRNMSWSPAHAEVTQKKRKPPRIKKPEHYSAPSSSLPSGPSRNAVMEDSRAEERYCKLIFEALSMMKDPNGSDVGAIRNYIQTRNGFKIKELSTDTPSGMVTSTETEDDAVHIAAYIIADAESKSYLAIEAVMEAERVSKIAEETESMLLLIKEINEQCSRGEVVWLA